MPIRALAIAILLPLISVSALAGPAPVDSAVLKDPERIPSGDPYYPRDAVKADQEGWVSLEFDVLSDGKAHNVFVVDGFNLKRFGRPATEWIQDQKFKPGTQDGVPVMFHWSGTVSYQLGRMSDGGVSFGIQSAYNRIKELLAKQQYAEAKVEIVAAVPKCELVADYSELKVLLFVADMGLNLPFEALDAIRHATQEQVTALTGPQFTDAMEKRIILDAHMGEFKDAQQTYKRLDKRLSADDPAAVALAKIDDKLASGTPIQVSGLTDVNGVWQHRLARPDFGIIDVEKGSLASISIRCDRAAATTKYQDDFIWSIAASWGECALTAEGTPGTQFVLVELRADDPLVSQAGTPKALTDDKGAGAAKP